MEGGTEQDYYELEMLLGEIPNVTSGNPHPEESIHMKSLEGLPLGEENGNSSSPTTFANFYHASQAGSPNRNAGFYCSLPLERPNTTSVNSSQGLFDQKIQANGNLDAGKITTENDRQVDSNLPDDQSLVSAFTQLSFKNGVANGATSPHLLNYKNLQKCTFLSEGQYPNNLKKPHSSLDTGSMVIPSPRSPNTLNGVNLMHHTRNGLEKFDAELTSQEIGKVSELDIQGPKKQKNWSCQQLGNLSGVLGEQRQCLPVYSGATPLAPNMHSFQVLPSISVPRVEFSVGPYQQQYFLDAQSPIPYVQTQQINHSHIPWQHMEEEQYYRMQQQYLYMQQLRNQVPEARHPIQANANMATVPISGNARQPYFKMPIPHQVEQTNEDPIWNNAPTPRGFSQSELKLTSSGQCRYHAQGFCGRGENCPFTHGQKQTSVSSFGRPALSSEDYEAVQVLDRVGKLNFPEKILTRAHGLNLLKVINSGSIGSNESVCHLNNEKLLLNDHFHHQSSILNAGSFQLDGRSSQGSSPDNVDLRINNLRSQPPKYNSLDEVMGKIHLIAKDQHGCRFLQKKFMEGSSEDVDKIFIEIIGHIVELMTDPFGNYLVQKLLEVCNGDQKMQILHAITRKPGDLVRISLDMHGTRAVQKVIETLTTPGQYSMVVSSLKPGIVNLMKDTNGNHVAQRCLQYLMPEYSEFLFEAAIAHCSKLAKDRHGCCVLQKCLSHCDGEQRHRLVCGVTSDALNLSQNQYGNYVVQFVFELRLPWATVDVLDKLEGSYGYLSVQKYSSNVVEKCLKYAGEERRPRIIQELITDSRLDQILQDPFGNYVIQAALNHSKGAAHAALVEAIRPHVPALRTSPYGKKILSSNGLKK